MHNDLSLKIWGRAEFDTEEAARRILKYLLDAGDYKPEYFGEIPPLKAPFEEKTLQKAIDLLIGKVRREMFPDQVFGRIYLERKKIPKVEYYKLEWRQLTNIPFFPVSSYRIESEYIKDSKRLHSWLEFCIPPLSFHDAWYASFCLDEQWRRDHQFDVRSKPSSARPEGFIAKITRGTDLAKGIPGVYWGTYFGPFYVEWLGREKFERLDCYQIKELETGGILLLLTERPDTWMHNDHQALRRSIIEALGQDAFYDADTIRKEFDALPYVDDYYNFDPASFQKPRRVPKFPF